MLTGEALTAVSAFVDGLEGVHDPLELGADGIGVGLVEPAVQQGQHPRRALLGTWVDRLRA